MEPPSVSHVVESLDRGGLERVVIDLARAQRAAGYRCEVICLFERGALAGELEACGVPVHACSKRKGLDLAAVGRLRGHLRRHRASIVHTHNAIAHYYAVVASAGLRPDRTINTRHGMGLQQARTRREWLYRCALPFTDCVATVCETARHRSLASRLVPAPKLVAVPNGIRLDAFVPRSPEARNELQADLGFAPGTVLVGSVGRLNWAKDPVTLLRAFARVHDRIPRSALVLVGDGALRHDVEACISAAGLAASVRLLGDRSDIPRLLAGLDLFALASVTEGYSIALLEACAAALPIVATTAGGNSEIVRDGENGWLVKPGNCDALATAISAALEDPAEARRRGLAGRQWVVRNGSIEAMLARYEKMYRASAGSR